MNLPDTINVAIGLVVLYFLLSTIGSITIDLIARFLRYREELMIATTNSLITGLKVKPWRKRKLLLDRLAGHWKVDGVRWKALKWGRKVRFIREYIKFRSSSSYAEYSSEEVGEDEDIVTLTDNVSKVRKKFWEHSKIKALKVNSLDAPLAIEPDVFSQVVVDLAVPRDSQKALPTSKVALESRLQAGKDGIPKALTQSLLDISRSSSISDNTSGERFWTAYYSEVSSWYAQAMEGATDRYKRATQRWLLCVGLAIVCVLNADTIRAIHFLSTDAKLRNEVADYSERYENLLAGRETKDNESDKNTSASNKDPRVDLKENLENLQGLVQIGYPLGWSGPGKLYPYDVVATSRGWCLFGVGILYKIIGLMLTVFAINLGAPFWHNLLGKLLNIRAKVTPRATQATDTNTIQTDNVSAANESDAPVPLEIKRDLSFSVGRFDARKAYWLAEASLLAYEPKGQIERKVMQDWFLPEPKCWDVQMTHVDTQAFAVATDEMLMVSFRGTEPKVYNDILTDVNLKQQPLESVVTSEDAVQLHAGFYKALDAVYAEIQQWLLDHEVKKKQLYITGHSLGGALALVLAYRLTKEAPDTFDSVCVYNFGCPRVGNEAFAEDYDRSIGPNTFRIIHGNDAVSKVPPRELDFRHVGSSMYFRKPDGVTQDVISLDRMLDLVIDATEDLSQATKSAIEDHSMEIYVSRCLELTGARVG